MASDLKRPDAVIALYTEEISEKMWPLPVGDLFMVGRRTQPKLENLNIQTIGDLANTEVGLLKQVLKSHGVQIWNYANGVENSVVAGGSREVKGIGNSTTIPYDVYRKEEAFMVLLSLVETVGMRQLTIFEESKEYERHQKIDRTIDKLWLRYDPNCVFRGCFANTKVKPLQGGVGEEDYPMMSSLL